MACREACYAFCMVFTVRALAFGFLFIISLIGISMAFGSFSGFYDAPTEAPYEQIVTVGGTPFKVDVADTPAERERGLGGTAPRPPRSMLFMFDTDEQWGIWMKDMNYPIDVLWITADGTLVHAVANMHPSSYPRIYRSAVPVRYVLELPAGSIEAFNLMVGDTVEL